ncbi:hypothetical protein [Actinomadura atramentaria]|uniref:hypothetical protein n=1 Tax=Actinomadura atramentaria TaxID=1990 RepID=UPI0004776857|nr:hypothetical protein [Actinomadura atramentaria]
MLELVHTSPVAEDPPSGWLSPDLQVVDPEQGDLRALAADLSDDIHICAERLLVAYNVDEDGMSAVFEVLGQHLPDARTLFKALKTAHRVDAETFGVAPRSR